ncbi:MAG: LuxR C-terminal-related transcriptional regulator [Anaerolineae bacterium]
MTEAPRTLSERETDVLRLLAKGATNQQIADELVISVNTVKVHVRNIFDKLGVQSRTEATLYAIHTGLIAVPQTRAGEPGVALDAAEDLGIAAASVSEPPLAADASPVADDGRPAQNGAATASPASEMPAPAPVAPTPQRRLLAWAGPLLALVIVAIVAAAVIWRNTLAAPAAAPTVVPATTEGGVVSTANQRWVEYPPLPTARGNLAVVAYTTGISQTRGIYAIAGQAADGVTGVVERFNWLDRTWSKMTSKPTPVRDVNAAVLGGRVYVPGGCDAGGRPTDVFEIYDPTLDRPGGSPWTTGPRLPRPLCGYALAAVEGKLYVFGGWDGQGYRSETLVYAPGSAAWQAAAPMPTPRAYMGSAIIDETVVIVGGANGAPLATTEVYDPSQDHAGATPWRSMAPLPEPRVGPGVASVGQRVYVVGGGTGLGMARFDLADNAWATEATPFVGEWQNLGMAAVHPKLYAMGGTGPLNVNRAYQAVFEMILPLGRPAAP